MSRHPQSDANPVRLSELLDNPGSSLGGLLQRADLLLQLQRLLASVVEPALARHFQVANVRQGCLVLLSPSAAWATRLRMQAADLLAALHQAGFDNLRSIEVRVIPPGEQPSAPAAPKRRERRLSGAATLALDLMAQLAEKDGD